jgi:glycosyltransferase involved in cell wall biosynthesis
VSRHLHIVCLDVPWPADYGGAIDMINRIMAFKKAGVLIHLHYFSYNERGNPEELKQFCESINVYERKKGLKLFSASLPHIVSSRINENLINRLNEDNHPVIVEGLHCTGILPFINKNDRKIIVRMHNEESIYYKELARAEKSLPKKIYFLFESKLIKKYTAKLPGNVMYACVSQEDIIALSKNKQLANLQFIPTFPAWQKTESSEGIGSYCLYQGNLSVAENEEAAIWLIKNVFSKIKKPLVIAGKNPSKKLERLANLNNQVILIANPAEAEMNDLVQNAHINLLPLFNKNSTGIRLKLLHALFNGRHCVVNEAMVKGTGLGAACHIGTNANAFASIIMQLSNQPFTNEETALRKKLLGDTYDNDKNAAAFTRYLW